MKTVEEVRRIRLHELLVEHGSWARLNELTSKKKLDSTYSQIAGQVIGSKSGAPKQMGSASARQLEVSLRLPRGWMDTDPNLAPSSDQQVPPFPTLAAALAKLSAALQEPMPDDVREDVAHALANLAKRRGVDRDQLQVLRLLATPLPATVAAALKGEAGRPVEEQLALDDAPTPAPLKARGKHSATGQPRLLK